jgi:hypothetical protein
MLERRRNIDTLAAAHAAVGEVDGPGRPLQIGRPLGHAYILQIVAEFQGFARDLHDLAVERMVDLSGVLAPYIPLMTEAASLGRQIDSGNAGLRSLQVDFRRVGLHGLQGQLAAANPKWSAPGGSDKQAYEDLILLRNALAHGNQAQLDELRSRSLADTVTWARQRLPALNRIARKFDRVVWEHLLQSFGQEPW